MKVGGLRLITVPAKYAYGEKGRMPLIPPNADIDMAVSLLSCKRVGTNPNSMLDPNAQIYVSSVVATVVSLGFFRLPEANDEFFFGFSLFACMCSKTHASKSTYLCSIVQRASGRVQAVKSHCP